MQTQINTNSALLQPLLLFSLMITMSIMFWIKFTQQTPQITDANYNKDVENDNLMIHNKLINNQIDNLNNKNIVNISSEFPWIIKSPSGNEYLHYKEQGAIFKDFVAFDDGPDFPLVSDPTWQWNIIRTNKGYYALQNVGKGCCVEIRGDSFDGFKTVIAHCDNTKDPNAEQSQWDIQYAFNDKGHKTLWFRHVKTGYSLVRPQDQKGWAMGGYWVISAENVTKIPDGQWQFIPVPAAEFTLYISDFEYESDIFNFLQEHKKINYFVYQIYDIQTPGITEHCNFARQYTNTAQLSIDNTHSFSYDFGQKITISVDENIPLISKGSFSVETDFDESWTTSRTTIESQTVSKEITYGDGVDFTPPYAGKYNVSFTLYEINNLPIPWTAIGTITGVRKINGITQKLTGSQIEHVFSWDPNFDIGSVKEIGDYFMKVNGLSGSTTASLAVETYLKETYLNQTNDFDIDIIVN